MTRFTDMEDARSAGSVQLVWKHQLIDPDGTILATTDRDEADNGVLVWGAELRPLAFAADRVSQRTAQMTIPVNDASLVPDRTGTLLHPDTGNRIRLHAGLVIDAAPAYQTQATMLADQVTADQESGHTALSISLVDMLRPVRSETLGGFLFADGESVESVVQRLADQVMSGASIAPTGFVTPSGSIEAGSKRDRLITELLEGCGHELTTDPDGRVYSRMILPSTGDGGERWRYGQADGLPVQLCVRVWTVKTPQGWRVEGGSFQNQDEPITVTVFDTDPTSEGYFNGVGANQIRTARLPFVKTASQAVVAGYAQLRRHGIGPMQVRLTSIPNPGMREGDLLELEMDALNASGLYRVMAYQLPLQVDGLMTIEARKVYDPEIGYLPGEEPAAGCTAAFSDDFNRADGNLEHDSPDWTEFGLSWGVAGQAAWQRWDKTWSFARHNTPGCSSDQFATVSGLTIPSGRFVGPMIRSSGQHDGYFAKCSSDGQISLELWQGGQHTSTLGTHNNGSIPASLTVTAVGTTITVSVGGTPVIITSDDQATGTYFGMHGYGGWHYAPVIVNDFSGGNA